MSRAVKPDIIPCYGEANTVARPGGIGYICLHYTAGATSKPGTAKANAQYYNSAYRGASADFFVDEREIVQKNPDIRKRYTWAVGGGLQGSGGHSFHGICKNANSISIEMCCYNDTGVATKYPNDGHWHIKPEVVVLTVQLVRWLMQELSIPADHVIRHYDVTGKRCPGVVGWNEDSGDISAWVDFKKAISATEEEDEMDINKLIEEMTPEQAAKIVDLAQRHYATQSLPDTWPAEEELEEAKALGITDGTRPMCLATRLETAVMVKRAQ